MPQLDNALATDPEDRWQSARDLKHALGWVVGQAPPDRVAHARPLPWPVAGVLTVALAVALWAPWRNARPADRPLRLDVDLGSDVSLGSFAGADAIISPDGTRLVYVSHNRLFTRRLDQPKAAELAGTEGAFAPFFSPVAFFAGASLKKIPVEGGAAITLSNGIVKLGNLLAFSPPRTTLICGLGVGRTRLKIARDLPQLDNARREA